MACASWRVMGAGVWALVSATSKFAFAGPPNKLISVSTSSCPIGTPTISLESLGSVYLGAKVISHPELFLAEI